MIDIKQLDFFQDHVGAWYYSLNNIPFTGCSYQDYPNGVRAAESNFLHGYNEGIQRHWYQNSQLESEQYFSNNIPNGKCLEWHENGVVRFEAEYSMGNKI